MADETCHGVKNSYFTRWIMLVITDQGALMALLKSNSFCKSKNKTDEDAIPGRRFHWVVLKFKGPRAKSAFYSCYFSKVLMLKGITS